MVLTNGTKSFNIQVKNNSVSIQNLEITSKDAAEYLLPIAPEDRLQAITRIFEVGTYCLQRTQNSQDLDFVKRQIQALLTDVAAVVGVVPQTVEAELTKKIGANDGVLAPIQAQVKLTSTVIKSQLDDVKNMIARDIDPFKESSVIGSAIKQIKNLLDPCRKDSIQGMLSAAVVDVTSENGALAKAVKSAVSESVKPLADEVDKLAKEIRGHDAATEALLNTTFKGATYEEEVVQELQALSKLMGAEISYVATDNKPGDIIVKFSSKSLTTTDTSIVIEVRDRESEGWGRKRISEHLSKAMSYHNASAAIFLSRTSNGLAQEIGEWGEGACGQGSWVATTHHLLPTAIRFLVVQQKLELQRASQQGIDTTSVEAQILRIRTTLKRITNINTHINKLRESCNTIASEIDSLKLEIRDALDCIEDSITV
ncbi:hypothetical protein DSM106972_089630 [Dulcicalothrix desertica PCC 7102]|uniref:Uncharacterized protein n=1 Tax=Dulcicalothrix desertica PCC 7102 TaxID=232991 RepID=A0A433UP38_9CYAN|nr:hypothetical protein [Dulcicalothrix desertica]RUS95607.1 hypothetical protein DSM106972_089630 [Dulcicalothrix desertica PCC 7102]TWH39942.1 hypothetical protein CAL7102_09222 [Dulcicalothrix desertica PCC 7102]